MTKDLTQGKPLKLVISFSLSILVSSLVSYLYGTVDSMMVGRFVSADALGAITNASQIMGIIEPLLTNITCAFGIVTGTIFGSGNNKALRNTMANITYLTVFIAACLPVLALTVGKPLLHLINVPPELMEMSYEYMLTDYLCSFTLIVPWIFGGVLRSLGDNRTPLISSLVSGALNVVFDFVFIYLCDFGVVGAALGTAAARLSSWIIYLYVFIKKTDILHFGRADARPSFQIIKKLVFLGVPIGLQTMITSVGANMLQSAINGQGKDVVNGVSTGGKVLSLVWTILGVFATTITYYCAQNRGAGKVDRVRVGVRQTWLLSIGVAGFMSVVSVIFGRYIFMLFVGNDDVLLKVAQEYLFWQVVFFPFMATLYVFRASVQGLGYTAVALGCGLIELVARAVVSTFFADNLSLLYFAGPAAWVGTSIFLLIIYRRVLRRLTREIAQSQSQPATEIR